MRPLTTEQQKLVEDNHNLIYHVLNQHGWSIDDYYDVAAIGLCTAAIKFDASLGNKFNTYACTAIKNAMLMELRKTNTKMRYGAKPISLDDTLPNSDGTLTMDGLITYGDVIESKNDVIEETVKCIEIQERIDMLPKRQREVLRLHIDGYSQREIAEMFGISKSYVSRLLKLARKKLADLA